MHGLRNDRVVEVVHRHNRCVLQTDTGHEVGVPPATRRRTLTPVDGHLGREVVRRERVRLVHVGGAIPDHRVTRGPARRVVENRGKAGRNVAQPHDVARRIDVPVAIAVEVEGILRRLDLTGVKGVAVCARIVVAVLEARIRGIGRETVAIEIVCRGLRRRGDEDEIERVALGVSLRLHTSDRLAVHRCPRGDLDGAREVVDE